MRNFVENNFLSKICFSKFVSDFERILSNSEKEFWQGCQKLFCTCPVENFEDFRKKFNFFCFRILKKFYGSKQKKFQHGCQNNFPVVEGNN